MKDGWQKIQGEHMPWIRARSSAIALALLVAGAVLMGFGVYGMDGHTFTFGIILLVWREVLHTQTILWRILDLTISKKTDPVSGEYVSDSE